MDHIRHLTGFLKDINSLLGFDKTFAAQHFSLGQPDDSLMLLGRKSMFLACLFNDDSL